MQTTMTPTMTPGNPHLDIPGNPSTAKSSIQRLNDRSGGAPLKVLSEYDWGFWQHNGFVVIRSAVPKEQVQRLAKFLWEFEEKDPDDPTTWYTRPRVEMQMKELTNTGMVDVYNHQYLWDNRQTPKVYEAFCDIWGTDKLWVTIDRANLNLPMRPGHEYKGFIHWDYDPETKPVNVQDRVAPEGYAFPGDPRNGSRKNIPRRYCPRWAENYWGWTIGKVTLIKSLL